MSLVNGSSMRAFPLANQLVSSLRASKPKPKAPASMAVAKQSSSDLLGHLSIAAACIVGFFLNLVLLYGVLSLLAPQLPLGCLTIYGSGYVMMLVIGRLEKKEEETWTLAMRAGEALAVIQEVDESDELSEELL